MMAVSSSPRVRSLVVGLTGEAFLTVAHGVWCDKGQTVPVLLRDIDMTFFPESGDLIALPNQRIYVEGK